MSGVLREIRDEAEAFLECAVWAFGDICDEGGASVAPLDDYIGAEDLDDDTIASAMEDCASFYRQAAPILADEDRRDWGHDFLLTRDGHGAGFWDGDWKNGDALSRIARTFGPFDAIHGDGAVSRATEDAIREREG